MSKIELDNITSGYNLGKINANFVKIENALTNNVLFRDATGSTAGPNQMVQDIDMDSQSILNLPTPTAPTNPVRLQDLGDYATSTELTEVDNRLTAADVTLQNNINTANSLRIAGDNTLTSSVNALDGRVTTLETGTSGDSRYIHYIYNDGEAIGGETTIAIPYTFTSIVTLHVNGVSMTQSLAFSADSVASSVTFAEPLEEGDEVVVSIGTEPLATPDVSLRREFVHNEPTLNAAIVSDKLMAGDSVNLKERTTGNGGGAMWDVVLSSSVTENGYNIVQCTGVSTLSLVLRVGTEVNIKQFGAIGDDTTNDSPSIQAAIDYAVAEQIQAVYFPAGFYLVEDTLKLQRRLVFRGLGKGFSVTSSNNGELSVRLRVTSGVDMFSNIDALPLGQVSQVSFENIGFYSTTSGGNIFNFDDVNTANVNNIAFFNCSMTQLNPAKHMILSPSDGDFFKVDFDYFSMYYPIGTTVPMMKFYSNTINNISFYKFWCTKSNKDSNTGTYAIQMDRPLGGFCNQISFSTGILQQPLGGFLDIGAPSGLHMQDLQTYDATVDLSNPLINCRTSTGNVIPESVLLTNVTCEFGSTTVPVLAYNTTSNNTGLVMVSCNLSHIDLGLAARYATAIGTTPTQSSGMGDGHVLQVRGRGIRTISSAGVEDIELIGNNLLGFTPSVSIATQQTTMPTMTATENDYDVGTGAFIRVSCSFAGGRSISGLVGGSDGRMITVINVGVENITMKSNNVGSIAANRLRNRDNADFIIPTHGSASYIYDEVDSRWRQTN